MESLVGVPIDEAKPDRVILVGSLLPEGLKMHMLEAKASTTITDKNIKNFVWRSIVCQIDFCML
jgi:hypothetical protein